MVIEKLSLAHDSRKARAAGEGTSWGVLGTRFGNTPRPLLNPQASHEGLLGVLASSLASLFFCF